MKIRMEYAAVVVLIVAICTMAAAYGLPGGDAPNDVSPLFNVRMDQAMEEMGAGIPGLDPNNAWSFGSINEKSLATGTELKQSADVQAARALTWWTCADTCGSKQTCRWTCTDTCGFKQTCRWTCADTCGFKQTCIGTCADTCAPTCRQTCNPTCWQTCGVTCSGFTCWGTCGATCGNKRTCRSTCPATCRSTCIQTCGLDCVCQNNNLFEVRT